ncbi:uncharacterized protein LOC126068350 [Elephas maximus indicus]|uniref:uncharacterized protein LOC126068350 n=1 Tax=Elephas maximus indicus TaxID=99487 RepID=UPI0021169957|nr:uncharacterized protein LOC126068350 [Elephas maximus indicus]
MMEWTPKDTITVPARWQCLARSRGLSSKGRSAATWRCITDCIELEAKNATFHFGLLMPLDQQAKKGVTVLASVIDPDYQEEIGLILHNGGKEEYIWNSEDPLGHLLVLPCLVIQVNGIEAGPRWQSSQMLLVVPLTKKTCKNKQIDYIWQCRSPERQRQSRGIGPSGRGRKRQFRSSEKLPDLTWPALAPCRLDWLAHVVRKVVVLGQVLHLGRDQLVESLLKSPEPVRNAAQSAKDKYKHLTYHMDQNRNKNKTLFICVFLALLWVLVRL